MAYSPDQQRDERGRFASNGGPSTARAEKIALGKQLDDRNRIGVRPWDRPSHAVGQMEKIMDGLRNKYGDRTPSEDQVRTRDGDRRSHRRYPRRDDGQDFGATFGRRH